MNSKTTTNKPIEKLQQEALIFYQNGKLAEAKKVCERILQISPVNVIALEIVGVNCLVEKRFDDAVAVYAKLIAVNPKTSSAYVNRGIALKGLGELDLAIQSFDAAISLNQKDAKAYYNRANTLRALKKFDSAFSDYQRVIVLDPDFSEAYVNLGGALMEDIQYSDAIQNLEKAALSNPTNDSARYNRGNAFHKIGKYGEALASFDRAIGINPKFSEAHYNRGNALNELGRFDEALASFDRAIGLNPKLWEAHYNRGNVLKELKRPKEALASYDKAIALNPGHAEAYNNRGTVLQELKRLDEALASYQKAIARNPEFFEARSNLAKLPKGMIPDHLVSLLLQQWVCPSDKALEAKALFLKANLLRHLGKYQESFKVLSNANLLRQEEVEEKIEGWREGSRKLQKEVRDWQAIVRDGADANAPKLLFILGPSRSGKTTIEFSIPENAVTKRGLEGRSAPLAIKDLQDLSLELNQHYQKSSSEVAQRVIDSLFYRQAHATGKITHQLVTNTNPFLIKVAHLIFDLYPNSHFVFVYRDPIDNAADIFSTEYREPLKFAYHAQTALDYVNWYHAVSDELAKKMEGRALKFNYADFVTNTELCVKSIAKLVGVDFEADPSQLDMTGRTESSIYRKFFLELLETN